MAPRGLQHLSDYSLVAVALYLGKSLEFLPMLEVCKTWYRRFDAEDEMLWKVLGVAFRVTLHISKVAGLRSKSQCKQLFVRAWHKKQKELSERHDLLVINARSTLLRPTDCPRQLAKLIASCFPCAEDFDVNWKCVTLENNSLLTLSARCLHLKCMKLLLDVHCADINISEVGGFNALILCAYHGFFEGVRLCIKRGADYMRTGRLRSGACLTAEHWAAVQGHKAIFTFLRAIRMRSLVTHPAAVVEDAACFGLTPSVPYDAFGPHMLALSLDSKANNPTACTSLTLPGGDSFCICGRGFDSQMIACDSEGCGVEWFHMDCVGLMTAPPEGKWFCPDCRGDSFSEPLLTAKRRPRGQGQGKGVRRKKSRGDDTQTALP